MENFSQHPTQILLLAFLAITFLQSGIDKILDWNGNMGWLKGHFSKTFLKSLVPMLLAIVLILECAVGIMGVVGIFEFFSNGQSSTAFSTAVLSCVTLLLLLFGQRVAKDYDGARTIVIYFVPAIILLFLVQ
ncbi:DoxX family protein [Flagellimonas allohymeniacidonis]|uniref:DoxX family protein n=1 Tax=Flagellimonas allohymeniacidonis TaxID=2517819 RepID=A0A4Q8QHD3_9FLAO|nr:DoxX family protein [Allomuricauda hymeniacidonis]TAI47556.1 DoxX family protein [Allomuricauda hymeniacidonis]